MAEFQTVGEALRSASSFLWEKSDTAATEPPEARQAILRGEVEALLQWVAGWTRTELLTRISQPIPGDAAAVKFQDAVLQRSQGVPLQYITGEAGFYGRTFQVKPGCLIPRPETEWLVEAALQWLRSQAEQHKGEHKGEQQAELHGEHPLVVDIGTGSGAIAATLAVEFPDLEMHAVDISLDALEIAKANAEALGVHIVWHYEDGLELLAERRLPLNLLVSNPPYIPSADVDELEIEVRKYEPRMALDGGDDGLDFYRRLVDIGDAMFAPGPAALFLEVGAGQARLVRQMFEQAQGWQQWHFRLISDLRGIERIVAGER